MSDLGVFHPINTEFLLLPADQLKLGLPGYCVLKSHGSALAVTAKIVKGHEMVGRAVSYSSTPALWWHGLTGDGKGLPALSSCHETMDRSEKKIWPNRQF